MKKLDSKNVLKIYDEYMLTPLKALVLAVTITCLIIIANIFHLNNKGDFTTNNLFLILMNIMAYIYALVVYKSSQKAYLTVDKDFLYVFNSKIELKKVEKIEVEKEYIKIFLKGNSECQKIPFPNYVVAGKNMKKIKEYVQKNHYVSIEFNNLNKK